MEEWRDIQGYEGLYQVSNNGRVRSLARNSTKGKILCQAVKRGYSHVCLSKDNKKKHFAVHRLVALAFIPNPSKKPEVNHIDGNRSNNNIANLEWVTRAENELHAYRTLGKAPNRPWEGKPRPCARKFTEEQVRAIRNDNRPCTDIGREYGVSKTAIRDIKTRKNYKEIA